MNPYFAEETMSEEFTKYHVKGLPFNAAYHHFTGRDVGKPHDHPFDFTTQIIIGGYVERVYYVDADGSWRSEVSHRRAGDFVFNRAEHIHEIIELPEGECWTHSVYGIWRRNWGFWNFDDKYAKFEKAEI